MQPPLDFEKIVNQKKYSVKTATLIAHDGYWDGHNHERRGRNTFLYRAPGGAFFIVVLTQWVNELDELTPITQAEALKMFETVLAIHEVDYADAFPTVIVQDA